MHTRGLPSEWPSLPPLPDPVALVLDELRARAAAALQAGIAHQSIVLDPGFGFGKRLDENYPLLARFWLSCTRSASRCSPPSRANASSPTPCRRRAQLAATTRSSPAPTPLPRTRIRSPLRHLPQLCRACRAATPPPSPPAWPPPSPELTSSASTKSVPPSKPSPSPTPSCDPSPERFPKSCVPQPPTGAQLHRRVSSALPWHIGTHCRPRQQPLAKGDQNGNRWQIPRNDCRFSDPGSGKGLSKTYMVRSFFPSPAESSPGRR